MNDSIVDEVRAIRDKIAAECGYDLRRIIEHAREAASRNPNLKYVTRAQMLARRRKKLNHSAKEVK